MLESFGLHLRNLIDFFYPRKTTHDTDIVATDFMESPGEWDSSAISLTLEQARIRADKELSHLTAERKAPADPTKPWNIGRLFAEIELIARIFGSKASQTKLHPDVRNLLTASPMLSMLGPQSYTTTTNHSGVTLFGYTGPSQKLP